MNIPASCPNLTFGSIPKGHLFHEKQKPVIIAHRGQPKKFQENTLDGVLSVQEIHADGFEVDIYVTKDKKFFFMMIIPRLVLYTIVLLACLVERGNIHVLELGAILAMTDFCVWKVSSRK